MGDRQPHSCRIVRASVIRQTAVPDNSLTNSPDSSSNRAEVPSAERATHRGSDHHRRFDEPDWSIGIIAERRKKGTLGRMCRAESVVAPVQALEN